MMFITFALETQRKQISYSRYLQRNGLIFAVAAVVALCFSPCRLTAQTSVVAIRTPNAIVIGADSKVTRGDLTEARLKCKINNANNIFWSYARIIEVPERGFTVTSIAAEAMSRRGTFMDRITNFENSLVPLLIQIMTNLKNGDPLWFETRAKGQSVVDIVFAEFKNGIPRMALRYFMVHSTERGISIEPMRRDCPGPDCKGGAAYAALGHHDTVDREINKNPAIWKIGLDKAVRYLIEEEIKTAPEIVGPPIAIVRLDANGVTWVSKGICGKKITNK